MQEKYERGEFKSSISRGKMQVIIKEYKEDRERILLNAAKIITVEQGFKHLPSYEMGGIIGRNKIPSLGTQYMLRYLTVIGI